MSKFWVHRCPQLTGLFIVPKIRVPYGSTLEGGRWLEKRRHEQGRYLTYNGHFSTDRKLSCRAVDRHQNHVYMVIIGRVRGSGLFWTKPQKINNKAMLEEGINLFLHKRGHLFTQNSDTYIRELTNRALKALFASFRTALKSSLYDKYRSGWCPSLGFDPALWLGYKFRQ